MKQFFLYLDESGNFEADSNLKESPSLVGGLLSYDKEIDRSFAANLLEGKQVHSCVIPYYEYGTFAIGILKKLELHGCDMVIFENKERLEVVDGDTTYLNIISEGIIQLLQLLITEHGTVKLNVIVAVRRAINREEYKSNYIINKTEYVKRLQEKIIIGLARQSNLSITKDHWSLSFASARKDARLMLADVVCHSWFRKNKKFDPLQKEIINSIYKDKFLFSVFPDELDKIFQRMLTRGNLGEAIYEVYVTSEEKSIANYTSQIALRLNNLNEYSKEIQLQTTFSKIMNLVYVDDWNQNLIFETIHRLKKYFLKELELKSISSAKFFMDIYLLSFTIATHRGDILQAEEEIENCKTVLPTLVNKWESFDYYFLYQIRKGIHLINKYELTSCIELMDDLEKSIDNTFSLTPLADGFNNVCINMKSDIKGKILGNRLQARFRLIKNDIKQLKMARCDSDRAMKEFTRQIDINRQYQYRSRIEYETGNYNEALAWLFKSFQTEPSNDYNCILTNLIATTDKQVVGYSLMHYVCIMAEACTNGEESISNNMYHSLDKLRINEYLLKNKNDVHPFEIIYWKLGTLLMVQGSTKEAIEKYRLAETICDSNSRNLTLKAISLGIKAEKVALLIKVGKSNNSQRYLPDVIKDLVTSYYNFMNLKLPLTMTRHFMDWHPLIENLKVNKYEAVADQLLEASKQIVY